MHYAWELTRGIYYVTCVQEITQPQSTPQSLAEWQNAFIWHQKPYPHTLL